MKRLLIIFSIIIAVSISYQLFKPKQVSLEIPRVTFTGVSYEKVSNKDPVDTVKDIATIISLMVGSIGNTVTVAFLIRNKGKK